MSKLTDTMNDMKVVGNFLRKQGESQYADILSDALDLIAMLLQEQNNRGDTKIKERTEYVRRN